MSTASFVSRDTSLRLTAVQAVQGTEPATREGPAGRHALTSQEEKEVRRLKQRHQEVTRHEEAHYRAAGRYALSPPSYDYAEGPDGHRYRVGGEVRIDMAEEPHPEDTLDKARVIKKAALAPADPSPEDRRIAARADRMMQKAREELQRMAADEAAPSPRPTLAFQADGTLTHSPSEPVFIDTRA